MLGMKILLSYGLHRNEYTDHVAKEVAEILKERGYDVELEKVPFGTTGWGKALSGKPLKDVEEAIKDHVFYLELHKPRLCSHTILEFDAAPEKELNPHGRSADCLDFKYDGNFTRGKDDAMVFLWGGNLADAAKNVYSIEIPQIYRRASERFLRTVRQRIKGDIDFDGVKEVDMSVESYFAFVPDKKATTQKYPSDILAKTIADGVEKEILSGNFLRSVKS